MTHLLRLSRSDSKQSQDENENDDEDEIRFVLAIQGELVPLILIFYLFGLCLFLPEKVIIDKVGEINNKE